MQLGFSSGAPRARATFPVGCKRASNPPRSWAPKLLPVAGGSGTVVSLGELVMILELGRAGKRRFSEFLYETACNQEETGGLEQRLDDEAEPVVAQRQPLVLQQPGVAPLDRPAPLPQPRAARPAALVEPGLGPERPAQLAVALRVVALVGEH